MNTQLDKFAAEINFFNSYLALSKEIETLDAKIKEFEPPPIVDFSKLNYENCLFNIFDFYIRAYATKKLFGLKEYIAKKFSEFKTPKNVGDSLHIFETINPILAEFKNNYTDAKRSLQRSSLVGLIKNPPPGYDWIPSEHMGLLEDEQVKGIVFDNARTLLLKKIQEKNLTDMEMNYFIINDLAPDFMDRIYLAFYNYLELFENPIVEERKDRELERLIGNSQEEIRNIVDFINYETINLDNENLRKYLINELDERFIKGIESGIDKEMLYTHFKNWIIDSSIINYVGNKANKIDILKNLLLQLLRILSSHQNKDFKSIIILNEGGFDIKALVNFFKVYFDNDADFTLKLVKYINKNQSESLFKKISEETPLTFFVFNFLKKINKLLPEKFCKLFNEIDPFPIRMVFEALREHSADKDDFISFIRNENTIMADIEIFQKLIRVVHNSVPGPKFKEIFSSLIKNKNIYQFNKFDLVKKMFNLVINILGQGGTLKIKEQFENSLIEAIKNKYVSRNFLLNVFKLEKLFNSGKLLTISMENFDAIKLLINQIETDLEFLKSYEAIKDLLKDYKPKNQKLFDLNLQINSVLRFRVLGDKDPYHFQVGIDTNCCQRLGGAGQEAARDSFANPQASVVILEWKNKGNWEILTQSYFHYVPQDNGFILDNVEENEQNITKSGIDINQVYAWYAQQMKQKLNLKYFLCGKAYNSLDNDLFKNSKLKKDPREFFVDNPYSDFEANKHLDLTDSNIDTSSLNPESWGQTKTARIIPSGLRKFALEVLNKLVTTS